MCQLSAMRLAIVAPSVNSESFSGLSSVELRRHQSPWTLRKQYLGEKRAARSACAAARKARADWIMRSHAHPQSAAVSAHQCECRFKMKPCSFSGLRAAVWRDLAQHVKSDARHWKARL
eukprot:5437558-Pleurochrysis_carterae.AAC.2